MKKELFFMDNYLYHAKKDISGIQCLTTNIEEHTELICFLCQQAAEKLIKHVILDKGNKPSHTHDLIKLLEESSQYLDITRDLKNACMQLTPMATMTRYTSGKEIDKGTAIQSIRSFHTVSAAIAKAGYSTLEIDLSLSHEPHAPSEKENCTETEVSDAATNKTSELTFKHFKDAATSEASAKQNETRTQAQQIII
jgi:HEPN domain-containing protein